MNLTNELSKIKDIDINAMHLSQTNWNNVAKPLNSLGLLEDAIIKISGIVGNSNFSLTKKCIIVVCADNGVVKENVTQTDSSVTTQVAHSLIRKTSSVCLMAKTISADIIPVDVGMLSNIDGLLTMKSANATNNIAKHPAMSREMAIDSICNGIKLTKMQLDNGYNIIGTGEMGIGNTTTSSAIASVLLNCNVETVTGVGSGLSKEGLIRKINVIKKSINLHKPDRNDVIDILSKVGGFDIATLTGIFIGGAIYHIPIVIDGFISSVAALCAVRLCSKVIDYILPSHVSNEPAGSLLLNELNLKPIIHANMCLGEGTGAVTLFPLLDMALSVYKSAAKFEEINVSQYVKQI